MSIGLTFSFSSAVEICSGRGAAVVFASLNVCFDRIAGLKNGLSILDSRFLLEKIVKINESREYQGFLGATKNL